MGEMNGLETEILKTRRNLKSLMDVPGKWADRVCQHRAFDKLMLDLNSSAREIYGCRELLGGLQLRGTASASTPCCGETFWRMVFRRRQNSRANEW